MLSDQDSKLGSVINWGIIGSAIGATVLLGGWAVDERIAIMSGKIVVSISAISLTGGVLMQAIRSEPRHSSFSKSEEIGFGLEFFALALLRWKGPRNLAADELQAPLPPLVGLVPGLVLLCLGLPFLFFLGLVTLLGQKDEPFLGYFYIASSWILLLFAVRLLIPAIRDFRGPRS